ncbi:MAG: carboxypeptidase regulatory-like domain-containing protein [Clostridia bacterium]|nr:carboxypeptidase regulatory-like domain-containing protein [Clostridia bacterium]
MTVKKLFSIILAIAILSTNLCAFAAEVSLSEGQNSSFSDIADESVGDEAGVVSDNVVENYSLKNPYAIHRIEYVPADEENAAHFLVHANTVEACSVEIFLKDENTDEVLLELTGDLPGNMRSGSAKVGEETEFLLPAYYVIEAALIRKSDSVGMAEYRNSEYTEVYERARSKSPEDFPGRQVVSFDDAGFAVLSDNVICASGAASGDGYTISYDGSLSEGDILLLDIGGDSTPVKVASSEENGDGTITVRPDDSIVLSDVYDHLQVSSYLTPVGAASDDKGKLKVIPFDPSFGEGALSMSGNIEFAIMIDAFYDKEERFFSAECWIQNEGKVEVTLGGEFDTSELDEPLEIVFKKVGLDIPKVDVEALLQVSFPLDIDVEAGGSASLEFNSKSGFKYNSIDDRFEKIDEDSSKAVAKIKGEVTVTAGPKVSLTAKLFDFIDAELSGRLGVRGEGKLEGLEYGGTVSNFAEDKVHACGCCLNFDVFLIAGIYAEVESSILEKLDVSLYDDALIEATSDKFGDAYCSFVNEKESPYGGEISAAFTECVNCKYRADISTVDYAGRTVTGVPVTNTGVYGTVQKGVSPCEMYLYPGPNAFSGEFEYSTAYNTLTMPEEPAALFVTEKDVEIIVTVRDNDTGEVISGASVSVVPPNNSTHTATTDGRGQCSFDKLPQGEYIEYASAENYEPKTINGLKFSAGHRVNSNISLDPIKNPTLIVYTDSFTQEWTDINRPGDNFSLNIDRPQVYSELNPNLTYAVDSAIDEIFDGAHEAAETGRRGCTGSNHNDACSNYEFAYLNNACVYGDVLLLTICHGYNDCGIGHICTSYTDFYFSISEAKQIEVTLDGILNTQENPDAKEQFIALLGEKLRAEGSSISPDKAYEDLLKGYADLCTWGLIPYGIGISFTVRNYPGAPHAIYMSFDELKGIIRKDFQPEDELHGLGTQFTLTEPQPFYSEDFTAHYADDANFALTLNGYATHVWVGPSHGYNDWQLNGYCRYFYGYNVSDLVIELEKIGASDLYITYINAEGAHKTTMFGGAYEHDPWGTEPFVATVTPIT